VRFNQLKILGQQVFTIGHRKPNQISSFHADNSETPDWLVAQKIKSMSIKVPTFTFELLEYDPLLVLVF